MIPADVPLSKRDLFFENYQACTHNADRLLLFAYDQKLEHLNKEFYGPGISAEDNNPEHIFRIVKEAKSGILATHLGLLARYYHHYPSINYLVKLNGKTNLVPTQQRDPLSLQLWTVDDVIQFKKTTNASIRGVGYTIYLGSEFESTMLAQAAQIVFQAHQQGLLAILWIYPRGKAVAQERDPQLIAGAAGVAASLGADFVKINLPDGQDRAHIMQSLAVAVQAAGTTKVLVSGGALSDANSLIESVYYQINEGLTSGAALGRNIHQRSVSQAHRLIEALQGIIYKNYSLSQALALLK